MKRIVIILSLIVALVIAFSASIPTLAANDSKPTTVSGTVPTMIEVTAPSGLTLTLDPSIGWATNTSASNGNIKSNKDWTLTVSNSSGYMMNGSTPLYDQLRINVAGQGLKNASPGDTVTGGKGASHPISFAVNQSVAWTDDPGSYSITITFAGSN